MTERSARHGQPERYPAEREARIQRILRQIERQLREQLPDPDQALERIEQEVVEIGREIREIIEQKPLEAASPGLVGSHAPCECGQRDRLVRLRQRTVVTLNEERCFSVTMSRPWRNSRITRTSWSLSAKRCSPLRERRACRALSRFLIRTNDARKAESQLEEALVLRPGWREAKTELAQVRRLLAVL